MTITAANVKELRERTGAGMMECKKALTEMKGDMDAAVDFLRKKGQAKADKKADRIAAEGCVVVATSADKKTAAMVELNSETDFVARQEDFVAFSEGVANIALEHSLMDVAQLASATMKGSEQTVEEARKSLVSKVGENIQLRRVTYMASEGVVGAYIHNGRIGVLVNMQGGSEALAKDIAMHIAAFRPQAVRPDDMSQELVEKEKEIFRAQALESGKPPEIVEKMIGGRIQKFLNEASLYGQAYAKDQDQTVAQVLKAADANVLAFERFEVGEGIEKKVDNFAEEVRAQAQGA